MASRQYSVSSRESGRGAQATGGVFDSGSWSDVSDHLDQTASYDSYSLVRNSYQNHNDELSERLFNSLDLGHGSFYLVDSAFDSRGLPNGPSSLSGPSSLPDHSMTNGTVPKTSRKPHHKHVKSKSNVTAATTTATSTPAESEQGYGMKTKFLSAWNNMRHGWTVKTKTSFSYNQPIWLFGKVYCSTAQEREEIERQRENGIMILSAMDQFKLDFSSRIWFTYRQNFAEIQGSGSQASGGGGTALTSDLGWGCMLRSAQMMIAQALVMHFMGRDWRWNKSREGRQLNQDQLFHHKIVSLFGDFDSEECPLSIHTLAKMGTKLGKQPGDWYGPASVAYVLRDAMEQIPVANPILNQLCVYVAPDCTVYREDVLDLCTRSRSGSCSSPRSTEGTRTSQSSNRSLSGSGGGMPWRALVLLIPVRLGGEALNPVYTPAIQNILAHDMCLGIIGGRPKHSVYFIGWQDDQLIHMDPHCCQETVDVREIECPLDSYHCRSPRKMTFGKMDPSCTIGFFCKTRMDFENFWLEAPKMAAPTAKGQYPMFVLQEGRCSDMTWGESEQAGQVLKVRHLDKKGRVKPSSSNNSDDFVFL